jgi:Tfp pilus assembly protein PilO
MINIGKSIFGSIVVAIGLFLFWPLVLGSWDRLALLRDARTERQELLTKRIGVLDKINKDYAEYQKLVASPDGKKFVALVPTKKNVPEIISAISDISGSSGVQVREFTVNEGKSPPSQGYHVLQLALDISGEYKSMQAFLERLEEYVRILNVDSLEVATDSRVPNQLNFTIRAQTYYIQ